MRKAFFLVPVILIVLPLGLWLAARQLLASEYARATLEQRLTAHLGRPVHVGSATAAIFPHIAVDLHDVTIGEAPPVRIGRIQVQTGLRSLFARALPEAPIRSLAFRDIVLGSAEQSLTIDLDSSLIGDRLDISSLSARARTTHIRASGALTSLARMEGAFMVTAEPLDLAEMVAIGSAIAPPDGPHDDAAPMHLVLAVTARHGQFGEYRVADLAAKALVRPGHLRLDDLAFQVFGGTFRGRVDADLTGAAPVVRLTGQSAGIDLTQLLKGSATEAGISGRLAASLALQASGADSAAWLRTARGTIGATVADGTLPHLDLVREVVLAFGKPSGAPAKGSGTAFQTLGGTLALANATLTSDTLAMTSRDLDLRGRGTLRLNTGAVDAAADAVLSPDLTAQAGTDLRRYAQQDGRVSIPVTVGGTLDNPSVSIDVAAAARRAVGNEIKRRVTDFLGGLFKKKKGGG